MTSALRADRLESLTYEVVIDGVKLFLTVDAAEDGRCAGLRAELQSRSDPVARSWVTLWSLAVTKALRCGCTLESVVEDFLFVRAEDGGIVQGDPQIRLCLSIADYVARRLAIDFLGRDDLRQGGE